MSKKIISVTPKGIRESIVGDANELPSSVELRKQGVLETSTPQFVGVSGSVVTASIESKYLFAATGSTIALPRDVPVGTEVTVYDHTLGADSSEITIIVDGSGSVPFGISGFGSIVLSSFGGHLNFIKVEEGSYDVVGQQVTSSWSVLLPFTS